MVIPDSWSFAMFVGVGLRDGVRPSVSFWPFQAGQRRQRSRREWGHDRMNGASNERRLTELGIVLVDGNIGHWSRAVFP